MHREHLDARAGDLGEDGFTLIELMMVVMIISILMAIMLPVFFGASTRAKDRATQANLHNALTAEKTVYTDTQSYDATIANLRAIEPSLGWGAKVVVQVGTNAVANDTVCLSEQSKSAAWFALGDIATSSATATAGTYFTKSNSDPCTANAATIATWAPKW